MKTVRFSKVVEKSGRPEVYLLMSETDSVFRQALQADKIMSLSGEAHGGGPESGTVGYTKKQHAQLLLFPKSLKAFAGSKIVGIKYDLFSEGSSEKESKTSTPPSAAKKTKPDKPRPQSPKQKKSKPPVPTEKIIRFVDEKPHDEEDQLKATVRQAMRALEKGNSVAAYNLLKRIVPAS